MTLDNILEEILPDNFQRASIELLAFLIVNASFITCFYFYLKRTKKQSIHFTKRIKIKNNFTNFLKISFLFSAFYFCLFIFYNHSGQRCEKLTEDSICACYASAAKYSGTKSSKLHWAKIGEKLCPKSDWFSEEIKKLGGG